MNFDRYEITRLIGKGSMGVVYEAHDPRIGRSVALKVLRADRLASDDFVARFLREARAIGKLSHPNIVTVHDSGQDNETLFIVMEFLPGRTLAAASGDTRLDLQEIIRIGTQVAEALDYAHRHGIVHRDIKPSNILLTADGQVKLTDFGIARFDDPEALHQTQAGEILGTPVYMSPEQVSGGAVDGRSDLYSLGVILYELATGAKPFRGKFMAEVFNAILEETPAVPVLPDTPVGRRLSSLIEKSMLKAPEERFQSGQEMAQALKGCLQRRKSDAAPVQPAPVAPAAQRRFDRRLIPAAALAFAAIGSLLYFFLPARERPAGPGPAGSAGQRMPAPETAAPAARPLPPLHVALLELTSEPPGAEVYIDGNLKGSTPLTVDLSLGTYEMRLQSPQHFDWEGQVQLDRAGQTPLRIQLVPMAEKKQ
jgi:tRNA A-37 threonylcarbamoyl transferase component Bud32